MTEVVHETAAHALLADGTTLQIRPAGPEDNERLLDLYRQMSPENLRLRFPVALVEDLLRTLPEGAFAANRGAGPVDLTGLEQLPLRLSAMVHDLPQITEADLNPLLARPDGITAVDVRVRVLPHRGHDPYLRRLR